MKSVGDDIYNAGTILGYRGDNWDSILKYSGLCMSDGRCDFRTWPKKLTGFDVETRIFNISGVSGRVSWFHFCRVNDTDSENVAHISGDDTMTALLQTRRGNTATYSISYKGHMYS